MRLSYKVTVVIMYFSLLCVTCDPALYPYRAQMMHSGNRYPPLAYRNYPQDMYPVPSIDHRMYHHRGRPSYSIEEPHETANFSSEFSNFLNAINEFDDHHEVTHSPNFRQTFPSYFPDLRVSNTLKHGNNIKQELDEDSAPGHDYPTTATAPPAENKGISVSFLKPDWSSITKPLENTNMDKWSGLLQLILAFITGSKSGNLEFKGFKDIIINGLVKPILTAKGNIKSFISKITIPLLSLLLINVEVLVTVWWLWEDCPKEMKLESTEPKTLNNYTHS